ncbi:MAG: hypothetical protein AUK48_08970 [Oscillatoriales cyanobacterium CG2_30_44_21]|nr:MAG: hypothetical protein AUK48_08970 [Oscillatoriales cyanobacterium CG2_30_44_21]
MNICPSCQGENPPIYQFCQFCGSKISVDTSRSLNAPQEVDLDKEHDFDAEPYDELIDIVPATPSATPTVPLNLTGMLGEISVQVNELAASQLAGVSLDSSEIEPLQVFTAPADFSTPMSSTAQGISNRSSSTGLKNIEYAGKTDVGVQRDRNEDDFAIIFQTRSISGSNQISDRGQRGLFILCDGMGGHDGGEVASTTVVNSIIEQFRPFWIDTLPGQKKLNEIICQANQEVFSKNESGQRESLGRMGTTLVTLAIHDAETVIAHVGDSRIYKVSRSADAEPQLTQLTRDHEVLNQLLDMGLDLDTALARPDVHQLTQAIGPHPSSRLEPAISYLAIAEPSLFLLCSDGLSDNDLIENNWRSHLLPILNREVDLSTGLDNLMELGNKENGHDNLTAILVLCEC